MSERTDGRSEQREIFLTSRPKGAASRRSSSSIPAPPTPPPATGEIALRTFLRRLGQRHILLHDDVEDDDEMEKALSEFTFRSRTSILVCLFRSFDQFFRGLPEVTFRRDVACYSAVPAFTYSAFTTYLSQTMDLS